MLSERRGRFLRSRLIESRILTDPGRNLNEIRGQVLTENQNHVLTDE